MTVTTSSVVNHNQLTIMKRLYQVIYQEYIQI